MTAVSQQMTPPLPAVGVRWAGLIPPLAAVLLSLLLAFVWPQQRVLALVEENGPVEDLTVLFYVAVVAALWWMSASAPHWRERAGIGLMLIACAARELDLHKTLTGTSVLKLSFYTHPWPLHQKLVALAIVLALAATAVLLARRFALRIWRDLRRGDALAITVLSFFATLVLTKIVDRSFAVLAEDYGITMAPLLATVLHAFEEIGECSLPLIAGVGLWQYRRMNF